MTLAITFRHPVVIIMSLPKVFTVHELVIWTCHLQKQETDQQVASGKKETGAANDVTFL